jgi:hypothetical protein
MSLSIAITSHRVLFFGLRRGWLDLVDAPALHEVVLINQKTGRWRGGDDYVDVLVMKVRDDTIKFSFPTAWSERVARAGQALSRNAPT